MDGVTRKENDGRGTCRERLDFAVLSDSCFTLSWSDYKPRGQALCRKTLYLLSWKSLHLQYGRVPIWMPPGDESGMRCYAVYSHHAH